MIQFLFGAGFLFFGAHFAYAKLIFPHFHSDNMSIETNNVMHLMTNRITKIGDYRTRNGSRVTVHEIDGKGTFSVKGSVWKMFRGKLRPRGLNIWKPCGHNKAVGHSALDIVGEWGVANSEPLSEKCNCCTNKPL